MPEVFTHGVASGDPGPDAVTLWTRARPAGGGPLDVRWMVARDEELAHEVASGSVRTTADSDHTVQVDVRGLEPGTTYLYAFQGGGERSAVGTTRTLPEGDVEHVRFAVFSCAKYSAGYFNALARMADLDDLDFVLCLGDYIYEYSNQDKGLGAEIGRAMDPDHRCVSLDDYRTRYRQARGDPDMQRLHRRHPIIAVPDDHEIADNTWRDGAKRHDPRKHGPWAPRKAAALRAWREWMPARVPAGDPIRLFRSFPIGHLAQLIVLDTRTRRDRQQHAPESRREDRTILGPEQREWLLDRLTESTAGWRLVANQVLVGQIKSDFLPAEVEEPLTEISMLDQRDHAAAPDHWDGYPAERRRVLGAIRDRGIDDVVFVTADAHSSWALDLPLEAHGGAAGSVAVEICSPSVTSENLDDEVGWGYRTRSPEIEERIVAANPHIVWSELDSHGFMVVDVTRERVAAEWHFVDTVHRPSDAITLAKRFEVRRGDPRLHPL